ncbi:MAG: Gfo/Idh/MocA family oxidoreductase [Deltaproteobacteria bacterium]|nr:Gfo/Idh/MocA family oxidoreductase [Deltaproteobacteria bacterium]
MSIDHTTRFEANWRKIKEFIDKGEIGELRTIQIHHIGEVGSLLNNATHGTDALLFYAGDVDWVLASVERRPERKDAKENATIHMQHKNGVESFYFFGGFRDYRYEAITFEGSKGKIEARAFRGWTPLMKIWRYDRHGLDYPNALREGEQICAEDNVPLKTAVKEIIEAIEQDKETICPGATGKASLELVMAAYESERQGRKKIKLPLQIKESPLDLMVRSGRMPHVPMTRYDEDGLMLKRETCFFE